MAGGGVRPLPLHAGLPAAEVGGRREEVGGRWPCLTCPRRHKAHPCTCTLTLTPTLILTPSLTLTLIRTLTLTRRTHAHARVAGRSLRISRVEISRVEISRVEPPPHHIHRSERRPKAAPRRARRRRWRRRRRRLPARSNPTPNPDPSPNPDPKQEWGKGSKVDARDMAGMWYAAHAGLILALTLPLTLTLGHVVRGPSWSNPNPNPDPDPNSRACGTRPKLVQP